MNSIRATKEISFISVMTALLIGAQFVLSAVAGVEVVTALLCAFCAVFGVKRGVIVSLAFTILRSLIFGFYAPVFVLYLVYYPLFSIFTAVIGKNFGKAKNGLNRVMALLAVVFAVALMTVCFTLFDDVITPLFLGYSKSTAQKYFIASMPVMLVQTVNSTITVLLLFSPLFYAFRSIKNRLI